jgi:hypothetical protein
MGKDVREMRCVREKIQVLRRDAVRSYPCHTFDVLASVGNDGIAPFDPFFEDIVQCDRPMGGEERIHCGKNRDQPPDTTPYFDCTPRKRDLL